MEQWLTPQCQGKMRKVLGWWTTRKNITKLCVYTFMNILRPPIEKCCVEKCNPSFPWKYVIQDAALSNIQGESMSGYKKCQLLPLDMLLCYNVVVSVRKDRLQDLSSLLTKTFSSFFSYFLCYSSCTSSLRQSFLVRFMWAFRAALTICNNLPVCLFSQSSGLR